MFSRIPGTDTPSMDGKRYYQQGFDVLSGGLGSGGWSKVTANSSPDRKNRTFSNAPFMFSNGQRGGPLATYLTSAKKRSNFNLWLNTSVKRVIRSGGHITAVEVEPFRSGGYQGIVPVTTTTGRVVLSAGTFGTAKILMRSGIGPTDQLEIVKASADGPTMINSTSWIPVPVGYNLDDHLNVSCRRDDINGDGLALTLTTDRHRHHPQQRLLLRLLRGLGRPDRGRQDELPE